MGIAALNNHAKGKHHTTALALLKKSTTLDQFVKPTYGTLELETAAAEICTVYHGIKSHHSFNSIGCGSRTFGVIFADSAIAKKVKLGRTKAEAIAQNVLAPYALETVLNSINRVSSSLPPLPFNIATDASNKGNRKLFPVTIRYFDINKEEPIVDAIIDLVEHPGKTSI